MSFDLKITVDAGRLDTKMSELERTIFQYSIPRDLDGIFQLGLQEAQRQAPVKTGALRGSGIVRSTGPLARELTFTMSYAMATNVKHPTKAGWFDKGADYIKQTLPTVIEKTVREQTGIVNRK